MLVKIFYENKIGFLPDCLSTQDIPNVCTGDRDALEKFLDYEGLRLDVVLAYIPNLFVERNQFRLTAKIVFASNCDLFIGFTTPQQLCIDHENLHIIDGSTSPEEIKKHIKFFLAKMDNKNRRGSFTV